MNFDVKGRQAGCSHTSNTIFGSLAVAADTVLRLRHTVLINTVTDSQRVGLA